MTLGSGVAFLSFRLPIFQHDGDYSLALSTPHKEGASQPFIIKSPVAPCTLVLPPVSTSFLTIYVSATLTMFPPTWSYLYMCCSGLPEFLPSTFYKRHLLHEVLRDLLGRDGCCQDFQGSLSLYIILSLISQFYTLSFHGPARLSTLEGGAVWQDHGGGKQTYLHLYTSYLGEPQNPKLERVWTQNNNTSKATVKSLDFR